MTQPAFPNPNPRPSTHLDMNVRGDANSKVDPVSLPATYGGPGWVARSRSHAEDVRQGQLWRRVGGHSEVAPLREVLLAYPPDSLAAVADPEASLLLEAVNLERMRSETTQLQACYEALGVTVHLDKVSLAPPNYVFMRDLFLICDEGALLARPASPVRAGEARLAQHALARLGVPLLGGVRGEGVFEGADALWLDPETLLVGLGTRTQAAGLGSLQHLLQPLGVRCIGVPVPPGTQHLLGALMWVRQDLVLMREDRPLGQVQDVLKARGVQILQIAATAEVTQGLAMNLVTVAPGVVVMPAGAPKTRAIYEKAGITCHEVDMGEYLRAAGGPGCATGILLRA